MTHKTCCVRVVQEMFFRRVRDLIRAVPFQQAAAADTQLTLHELHLSRNARCTKRRSCCASTPMPRCDLTTVHYTSGWVHRPDFCTSKTCRCRRPKRIKYVNEVIFSNTSNATDNFLFPNNFCSRKQTYLVHVATDPTDEPRAVLS